MTKPQSYLTRMILFLVAVGAVLATIYEPLQTAFMANALLNGLILGVLVLGIIFVLRQVIILKPSVDWLNTYRRRQEGPSLEEDPEDPEAILEEPGPMPNAPSLLRPVATLLGEREGRLSLSTMSMRSLLDSIGSRLDEGREISRYTVSLLIFLGLLGTFWGLLQTISSIGGTIETLNVTSSNFVVMFAELKAGLREPLSGMGTAFSSSLFGLAGSVILGFLDLQAGQAQNRFYNDLEEWLSEVTRLSPGGAGTVEMGETSAPAYLTALLEQTAESIDNLQRTMARSEEKRDASSRALVSLTEKLADLSDVMRRGQDSGMDEASREHLRNVDLHLGQIQEDMSRGRADMTDELRREIKLLARTMATALQSNQKDG